MTKRSITLAVARRPVLWPTALGVVFAFSRPGWWHRVPFLPVPDGELIQWRTATAYGREDVDPAAEDVVAYLEWRQRSARGGRRQA